MEESLISRDGSNGIKGLLIFLIILGHNSLITSLYPELMTYLYSFHIQSFFILPFLYPHKDLTKKRIIDYFVRFYLPYFFFLIIFIIIHNIASYFGIIPDNVSKLSKGIDNYWGSLFLMVLNGNAYLIDYYTGFQFLWFLPVMFSMTLIKDYFYNPKRNKITRIIIISIAFICFLIYFVLNPNKILSESFNFYIRQISPSAITYGLGAFFMGYVILRIIRSFKNYIYIISIIIFTIISIIWFYTCYHLNDSHINYIVKFIMTLILPFAFFIVIFKFKDYIGKSKVLRQIGKYSFAIYIIHPILIKIGAIIFNYMNLNHIIFALLLQILIIVISYYCAVVIYQSKYIKRILFPSNLKEFLNK